MWWRSFEIDCWRSSAQFTIYDRNVRTRPLICWRQSGHVTIAGAHQTQDKRWPHGRNTTPTSSAMQILHSTFFNRRSSDGRLDESSSVLAAGWSSGTAELVEATFELILDNACSLSSLLSPTEETADKRSCVTWLSSRRFASELSKPSSSICPSRTADTSASVLVNGLPVELIFLCITARTRPAFNPIDSASNAACVFIASSMLIVGVAGIDWFPVRLPLSSDDRWTTLLI